MAEEQLPLFQQDNSQQGHQGQDWLPQDWGEASEAFDEIKAYIEQSNLLEINEAETRLTIIDRILHEVLGWRYGQIKPEEPLDGDETGYIDYVLRSGDFTVIVEAKRFGKSFPSPTKRKKLRLFGSGLGADETVEALNQAIEYAEDKNAIVTPRK